MYKVQFTEYSDNLTWMPSSQTIRQLTHKVEQEHKYNFFFTSNM